MKQKPSQQIIYWGIVVWLLLVTAAYFVYHKPVAPEFIVRLFNALYQIVIALAIVLVSGGVGRRIFLWVNLDTSANPPIQSALGLGLFAILFLIIGSMIGINVLLSVLLLIIPIVLFSHDIRDWLRSWRYLRPTRGNRSKIEVCIASIVIIIAIGTLLIALAPPLKFDALVYHLALPDVYISEGRISYQSGNIFWGMPQLTEMLYTWAMSLGGVQSAAVIGWCFGILTLIGVFIQVKYHLGLQSAWVAVTALLGGYTLASSLAWGYVGWMSMLFGWGVMYSLDIYMRGSGKHALYMAAVFAGFGFGVKYTAGLLGFASALYLIYCVFRGNLKWGDVVRFVLIWIAVSLPWLLKNVLVTGNPIYPLLFTSGAMDTVRLDLYQGNPTWGDWRDIFLLPLRATLIGLEGAPGYSASIGPLLLSFGMLAFLRYKTISREMRGLIQISAFLGLSYLVVWAIVGRLSGLLIQTRLYLSVFPGLAVLTAIGFDRVRGLKIGPIRIRVLALSIILIVIGLTALQITSELENSSAISYLFSNITHDEYLQDNLGWFYPAMAELNELPQDASVLMLWEARNLYCPIPCQPDEILDRWQHAYRSIGTPEEIIREWGLMGYSHILINKLGMDFVRTNDSRYTDESWNSLDVLIDQLDLIVNIDDAYALYRLSQ